MSSSRRSSSSSIAGPSSPLISPELVLVNDADNDPANEELDFSSDDELPDDFAAQSDRLNASIIPPLPPILILLYLSIPYLKLGPMFLPTSGTPLSQTIPTLLVCAAFAASTRELWYLLARYLRNMDIEDVILDVFARGSDKTRRRHFLRTIVRMGTLTMRVLLASVSLRGSHISPPSSFPQGLICRSLCGCTPSSRPRTLPPCCSMAPHGHSCSCHASLLRSTLPSCEEDHICNLGVVFGLLDMGGSGILCPRKGDIVYRSSLGEARCPLAGNQLSVHPCLRSSASFFTRTNSIDGICLLVVVDYSSIRVSPGFDAPHNHQATSSSFLQDVDRCQCRNSRCTCTPFMCVCVIF